MQVGRQRSICRSISSARSKTSSSKSCTKRTNIVGETGRVELDTHADTIVLGANCTVLAYTGKECDVSPYTDAYDAIKHVPVVTGATVWTRQSDGQEFILVFHEALWMGDQMKHSLVNPNQVRANGIDVMDNPYSREPMGIYHEDVVIPSRTLIENSEG